MTNYIVYGRLTIIRPAKRFESKRKSFICKCSCGIFLKVREDHLLSGHTLSCGCLHRDRLSESLTTHNGSGTRLYNIWCNMKQRCNNPKNNAFIYYGGKGIAVCQEWEDFNNFREWAESNGYLPILTIDRTNENLGYNPGNCTWMTQSENTTKAHLGKKHIKRKKEKL